jgi:hypothetical protein
MQLRDLLDVHVYVLSRIGGRVDARECECVRVRFEGNPSA